MVTLVEGGRSVLLQMTQSIFLKWRKCSEIGLWRWLHYSINLVKCVALYILNEWIWHINYTTIKLLLGALKENILFAHNLVVFCLGLWGSCLIAPYDQNGILTWLVADASCWPGAHLKLWIYTLGLLKGWWPVSDRE